MSDRICTVAVDQSTGILIYNIGADSPELRRELLPKNSKALWRLLEKHPPSCGTITVYQSTLSSCQAAVWTEEGAGCLPKSIRYSLNGQVHHSKPDFLAALIKDCRAKPLLGYFLRNWEI